MLISACSCLNVFFRPFFAALASFRPGFTAAFLAFFSSGDTKNERLWFKCSLKLGQLLLDVDDNVRFQKVINTLLEKSEDGSQGTSHMMEIYALQIQMYGKTRDTKKVRKKTKHVSQDLFLPHIFQLMSPQHVQLKDLYAKALSVQNNVPHPRTLGIIHDCGGKTYMQAQQWKEVRAGTVFFLPIRTNRSFNTLTLSHNSNTLPPPARPPPFIRPRTPSSFPSNPSTKPATTPASASSATSS